MTLSILQKRQHNVVLADLCSAMDLIAFITADHFLVVYRTISWEKILTKNCDEFGCGQATVVKFSPDGKHIALGFSTPSHVIVTLETQETQSVKDSRRNAQRRSVRDLWWIPVANRHHTHRMPLLAEVNDVDDENRIGKFSAEVFKLSMIVRQHDDRELVFFAFGLTMVARWQCDVDLQDLSLLSFSGHGVQEKETEMIQSRLIAASANFVVSHHMGLETPKSIQFILQKLERLAEVQLQISQFFRRVDDHVNTASKKWKEAVKTIPMKLSLLKTLIEGYQLHLSPVEFLHTVALCGMWHPAASTSFSQHWNEQGLGRLRSGIDAASLFIIRTLQFKIAPLTSNIFQLSRLHNELLEDLLRTDGLLLDQAWKDRASFLQSAQHLIFAVDDATFEAKRTREAFMDFIQFLRDGMQEATHNTLSDQDFTVRKQCAKLFHGDRPRLDFSNPEHITGTFLCQHLQKISSSSTNSSRAMSETMQLLSSLTIEQDRSAALFAQKPLFEQAKIFRDTFEHSLDVPIPSLCLQRTSRASRLTSKADGGSCKLSTLPLKVSTPNGDNKELCLSRFLVTSQLLTSSGSVSLLISVSDPQQENQLFFSRIRVSDADELTNAKTIVYDRKGAKETSECAILVIGEQVRDGERHVVMYRFSLTDATFSSAEDVDSVTNISISPCNIDCETFSSDEVLVAEANASRGVLCLADKKGRILIVDLENEEEEEEEDEEEAEESSTTSTNE